MIFSVPITKDLDNLQKIRMGSHKLNSEITLRLLSFVSKNVDREQRKFLQSICTMKR
jgi:hypothetical protein